jgi:hypothetical protein
MPLNEQQKELPFTDFFFYFVESTECANACPGTLQYDKHDP